MTGPGFDQLWRRAYSDTAPLGYLLRAACPERWTRFHALPQSKRYATTAQERAIVLDRANRLGTYCFGDAPVWIVTCRFCDDGQIAGRAADAALPVSDLPLQFLCDDPGSAADREADRGKIAVYAASAWWQAHGFDALLTDVAEGDETAIFFSAESQRVFAPYDGGFDLISGGARDGAWISEAEERFCDWMSDGEDRL